MKRVADLTGRRVGSLTICQPDGRRGWSFGRLWWHCRCACGHHVLMRHHLLVADLARDGGEYCGCNRGPLLPALAGKGAR